MNPASLKQSYLRWWLDDLPPLSGALRPLIYGGLFALSLLHWKSPLLGFELYAETDPTFFRPAGLLHLLGLQHIPIDTVRTLVRITGIAWVFAALGLFTRISMILTGAGVLFLHGLFWNSNALNHSWSLPAYTLALLAFAKTTGHFSLDHFFRKHLFKKESPPPSPHATSGLIRKAILVLAVGFYFASGMSKLLESGFQWCDGLSLQFHLIDKQKALWLADRLWLCRLISILTIILELGSLAALFSRRARLVWVLGILSFHFGIWITVGPWYFTNMLCLALFIDWGALGRRLKRLPSRTRQRIEIRKNLDRSTHPQPIGGVLCVTPLLPLILIVAFSQIEWWPLTNVPMFSSYCGPGYHMGVPKKPTTIRSPSSN